MPVGGHHIASLSFADDLALVACSQEEMQLLIEAYLAFCGLLGVKVTKVQLWANSGPGQEACVGDMALVTAAVFSHCWCRPGL